MKRNQDTAIIIPVYNEAAVIVETLSAVLAAYATVICVNDGSSDNSAREIQSTKAYLINHPINMGQGAAIQTGLDYACQLPAMKYFVTFDADGQHSIADVERMVKYIKQHPAIDIVLGSRFLGIKSNLPPAKKLLLKGAVIFTNRTSKLSLTDAHNGLRVFNRRVAESLNITMPDMAHASEIVHRIHENNYTYHELPITVSYTEYSMKKGQSMMNAFNILFDIFMQRITRK